ncbi:hypothetical protein D187_007202 [Cystobacter fuscus DSM 2262]|uniref:Uncharacterized protein n=1 Tax=Cystobacter fuscus (strain ATCC 25194 / DSM 2262 / NBRC 100088 / M29) TaxID=1242864 RepID=S9QJW3_CYSF2|nr:hypothetical protein [Cystobacter fuscus]EPX56768.1 hypothetical protein D187_007202 [Cystobacter fuscus DSM 2262]
MNVLDKVLTLRPTSVVSRLGPASRLPVLSPRELSLALENAPAALPCLPVPARPMLPGLLAAARGEDAVLGLVCPHPLADRGAAERFVAAVQEVAEADGHARPLFLQAGPVRVTSTAPASLAPVKDGLFRLVDTGFSLVALDVSRLPASGAVEAVLRLSETLVEREFALEVSLPGGPEGEELEGARLLLEGLAPRMPGLRFLRVSESVLGEEVQDVQFLRSLVDLAGQHGLGISVGEAGRRSTRVLPTYVAAGVKKVECAAPFERLALAVRPAAERESLEQKAHKAGLTPGELLGVLGGQLSPLESADASRLEALTFAEASEVLEALGASRTGWKSMLFLAENRGD